jgi:hypothetical protein
MKILIANNANILCSIFFIIANNANILNFKQFITEVLVLVE